MSSNPYETVQRTAAAITLGIATVAANFVENWLTEKKSWPVVGLLVAVAMVVVLSQLLAFFFDWILDHSRPLRALLFRGYDVEGTWVDLAWENGQITSIGITCLEIRDYELSWHGENHNLSGQVVSAFRTYTSIVEWPKVRFWFKNDPSDRQSRLLEGICELLFEQRGGRLPIHYSGWGGLVSEQGVSKVVGWRITDEAKLEALHSARTRADALIAIARDFAEFGLTGEAQLKRRISMFRDKPHNPGSQAED